jgi:hypothetical protein
MEQAGPFDPLADAACPDCRAILLGEPPLGARPEGVVLGA